MTIAEIKIKLVEAHRNKDWETARVLSQLKQKAKKIQYCSVCGTRCVGIRCNMHARTFRNHGKSLPHIVFTDAMATPSKATLRGLKIALRQKGLIPLFAFGFAAILGCKSSAVFSPIITPPLPAPLAATARPLVARLAVSAPTNNVTLGWDYDTNTPGLQKFTLYQGSISKHYTNVYDFSIALMGAAYANPGTNYFNLTATVNNFESDFAGEITYVPVIKPVLLYIDTFVQTNSTLNSNLWGNVMQFPTVILTNPPSPIFGRTLIQMNYK